ncbi:hypothetical protein RND71_025598 [Anisodus tanguticus]|uniref:Pentatricopeptide repeat-containing protein n=1 Tax=Anisodus tanguticus TaxID=243964 RepID=A0AAE1RTB7_9SOLA|nr:hypothetical protein RND71_025598 [Anisodus tanguticus]
MLDTYCMNGLAMKAHVLFESIHSARTFPIDSSTYKLLYKSYTKADMKELVQSMLTCMDKDGIIPNKKFFLDALGAFGSAPTNQKAVGDNKGLSKQRVRVEVMGSSRGNNLLRKCEMGSGHAQLEWRGKDYELIC